MISMLCLLMCFNLPDNIYAVYKNSGNRIISFKNRLKNKIDKSLLKRAIRLLVKFDRRFTTDE